MSSFAENTKLYIGYSKKYGSCCHDAFICAGGMLSITLLIILFTTALLIPALLIGLIAHFGFGENFAIYFGYSLIIYISIILLIIFGYTCFKCTKENCESYIKDFNKYKEEQIHGSQSENLNEEKEEENEEENTVIPMGE